MENLDTTTLVIGEEPQYFFDNGIIEISIGLMRTIHSPTKIDANPVIQRDQPWEHVTYFSCNSWTLWRDRESSQFRCLYTDWKIDRDRVAERGGSIVDWDKRPLAPALCPFGRTGSTGSSRRWGFKTKPATTPTLSLAPRISVRRTTSRRWRFWTNRTQNADSGVYSLTFRARRHRLPLVFEWHSRQTESAGTVADRPPTFGKQGSDLGDVTITDYDPVTRSYLLFTRHPWQGSGPRPGLAQGSGIGGTPGYNRVVGVSNRRNTRRVFLSESADFFNWSEPRIVIAPDPHLDNLDDAFLWHDAPTVGWPVGGIPELLSHGRQHDERGANPQSGRPLVAPGASYPSLA